MTTEQDAHDAAIERILRQIAPFAAAFHVRETLIRAGSPRDKEPSIDASPLKAAIRTELEAATAQGRREALAEHKLPPITCCGHEGPHKFVGPMFGCEYHGCPPAEASRMEEQLQ